MKIKGINPQIILEDVTEATNPYSFEDYCLPCIHLDTEDCPFRGKVWASTNRRDINCNNFWD